MSLKHLGNCKVVALYTTEQVQTEKTHSLALFIIFNLRYYTFCRAFSLAQYRSLSRTVTRALGHTRSLSHTFSVSRALSLSPSRSRSHSVSLLRTFGQSRKLLLTLSFTLGLSRAHFRSLSRTALLLSPSRSRSHSVSLCVRFSFVQYGAS